MKMHLFSRSIMQFFLLLFFWLLLSGHYDFFHISVGVLSSLIIILMNISLHRIIDRKIPTQNALSFRYVHFLFIYIPFLIWQIMVAALAVSRAALGPKSSINPSLLFFKTKLPSETSKVILANSITLTPGTITIGINKDEFIVHSLMDASSEGINNGLMIREVAKLYTKCPSKNVSDIDITVGT